MKTVQFNDDVFAHVLTMVARDWALLAVKNIGTAAEVNHPYHHYISKAIRRRAMAADDRKRALAAKALFAMTGQDLPEPERGQILCNYRSGPASKERLMFRGQDARAEAMRVAKLVIERAGA